MNQFTSELTPLEIAEAEEKGRWMAASMMYHNVESRTRVEAEFGIEYCRQRYPEVYRALEEELKSAESA